MRTAFLFLILFLTELALHALYPLRISLVLSCYMGLLWSGRFQVYHYLVYGFLVAISGHLMGISLLPVLVGLIGIYCMRYAAYQILTFPQVLVILMALVSSYVVDVLVRYYEHIPISTGWTFFEGIAILGIIVLVLQTRAYGS